MKVDLIPAAALATAALLLVPAPVIAQGPVGTLERGTYVCELPGDAGGTAGIPQPELDLKIHSASRYSSRSGNGTYLRRGDRVILTSGPRRGETYQLFGNGFMRRIEDGKAGPLRCVRQGR